MASVTNINGLTRKTSFDQVLRDLPLFPEEPSAPIGSIQQGISNSLNETLADLQSADLEAIAAVLRNVVGQIDTLLLERQLAEYGFDAVRAGPYNGGCTSLLEPADALALSNSGKAT